MSASVRHSPKNQGGGQAQDDIDELDAAMNKNKEFVLSEEARDQETLPERFTVKSILKRIFNVLPLGLLFYNNLNANQKFGNILRTFSYTPLEPPTGDLWLMQTPYAQGSPSLVYQQLENVYLGAPASGVGGPIQYTLDGVSYSLDSSTYYFPSSAKKLSYLVSPTVSGGSSGERLVCSSGSQTRKFAIVCPVNGNPSIQGLLIVLVIYCSLFIITRLCAGFYYGTNDLRYYIQVDRFNGTRINRFFVFTGYFLTIIAFIMVLYYGDLFNTSNILGINFNGGDDDKLAYSYKSMNRKNLQNIIGQAVVFLFVNLITITKFYRPTFTGGLFLKLSKLDKPIYIKHCGESIWNLWGVLIDEEKIFKDLLFAIAAGKKIVSLHGDVDEIMDVMQEVGDSFRLAHGTGDSRGQGVPEEKDYCGMLLGKLFSCCKSNQAGENADIEVTSDGRMGKETNPKTTSPDASPTASAFNDEKDVNFIQTRKFLPFYSPYSILRRFVAIFPVLLLYYNSVNQTTSLAAQVNTKQATNSYKSGAILFTTKPHYLTVTNSSYIELKTDDSTSSLTKFSSLVSSSSSDSTSAVQLVTTDDFSLQKCTNGYTNSKGTDDSIPHEAPQEVYIVCEYARKPFFIALISLWTIYAFALIFTFWWVTAAYSVSDFRFYLALDAWYESKVNVAMIWIGFLLSIATASINIYYSQPANNPNISSVNERLISSAVLFVGVNILSLRIFMYSRYTNGRALDMSHFSASPIFYQVKNSRLRTGYGLFESIGDVFNDLLYANAHSTEELRSHGDGDLLADAMDVLAHANIPKSEFEEAEREFKFVAKKTWENTAKKIKRSSLFLGSHVKSNSKLTSTSPQV
jgi:hypothetical protein